MTASWLRPTTGVIAAFALIISAAPTSVASQSSTPHTTAGQLLASAPAGAEVEFLEANGTGCPKDSDVEWVNGSDANVFALKYTGFGVKVGPKPLSQEARKHCLSSFQVTAPEGYSYSLKTVSYSYGWYITDAATKSNFATRIYMQGENKNLLAQTHQHTGLFPSVGSKPTFFIQKNQERWSPCNKKDRLLNVRHELSLTSGTKPATAEERAEWNQYGEDGTHIELQWKTC